QQSSPPQTPVAVIEGGSGNSGTCGPYAVASPWHGRRSDEPAAEVVRSAPVSSSAASSRGRARRNVDRWAAGRTLVRAANPGMAELVDAHPDLDPDQLFERLPSDLWGALVLQVIGQQLSLAAAAAILTRLEALHGGRMPTPADLLATDAEALRGI